MSRPTGAWVGLAAAAALVLPPATPDTAARQAIGPTAGDSAVLAPVVPDDVGRPRRVVREEAPGAPGAAALVGVRMPAWAADPGGEPTPGAGPPVAAPDPPDPAVLAALERLRSAAGAPTADGLRPARRALVALEIALAQVGDPYVWGDEGPDTFDCSGLVWWSYAQVGVLLPRVSRDQHAGGGAPVALQDLLPGDLVFFETDPTRPGVVSHVAIYAGRGLMVAAPRPGLVVRVEPVFPQGYAGAVRPVPARPPAAPEEEPVRRVRPEPRPPRPTVPAPAPVPPAPSTPSAAPPTEPSPTSELPAVPPDPDASSTPPDTPSPSPTPTEEPTTTDQPTPTETAATTDPPSPTASEPGP